MFRPTDRTTHDVIGSQSFLTTFLPLSLRVAQHFKLWIGSRNMTSVSSSDSTELGHSVSALKPAQPGRNNRGSTYSALSFAPETIDHRAPDRQPGYSRQESGAQHRLGA